MGVEFKPVWFDSMGAKSACTLIKTSDITLLIDPGIAAMQPSFPASNRQKLHWMQEGKQAIKATIKEADAVVISHYHHDHYLRDDAEIYRDKTLFAKDPNEFINDSQRGRALHFYEKLSKELFGRELMLEGRKQKVYATPLDELPLARKADFGDYSRRREELLSMGEKWFQNRVKKWNASGRIPVLSSGKMRVVFPEGQNFSFGKTELSFSRPLFHGIEFSRVGWVFSISVSCSGERLIHTSDLNGIYIEDYAARIINQDPNILILDGPPTYMAGYMMNRTNLNRCIRNACRVVRETNNLKLLVYDHHLLRESKYKERTKEVWEAAREKGIEIMTAAEYLGEEPVIHGLS
jgi:hypothetical protein